MLAAVRVRGVNDVGKQISDTLQSLRLHNKNNCVLLGDSATDRGMLVRAKDYIAYGEVDADTVATLLRKRGRVDGESFENVVDDFGYEDIDAVVDALADGDLTLQELRQDGLKVPFRLSPPSKGFRGTKQHYNQGGSLGERDDMDELLRRMI